MKLQNGLHLNLLWQFPNLKDDHWLKGRVRGTRLSLVFEDENGEHMIYLTPKQATNLQKRISDYLKDYNKGLIK